MPCPPPARIALAVPFLALPGLAQDPTTIVPLLEEGDAVTGVGLVTRIDNLSINDKLGWIVEADTDNPDADADSVLIRNGVLLHRENESLADPPGALLDSFDTVLLNDAEHSFWNFFLDGTSGSSDDTALYFDTTLVAQEGDVVTALGVSPGTTFRGFFECKLNDSNVGVALCTVDDPALASTVDQAFLVYAFDEAGSVIGSTVPYKEGDLLTGQTEPVNTFGTNPHQFAFNNSGSLMFRADLDGDTSKDGVVYLETQLLAQEGSPSPFPGRNWTSLSSSEMDVGDNGHTVFSGQLDGDTFTDSVLVRDGQPFQQEGTTLPDIAPFTLTSFGSGPLCIDRDGDVLWFGDWNDPNTDADTGLFLNDELIVQEGVTTIGGVLVDSLSGVQDGYALSDNGKFIVFEATLADGTNGAYLVTTAGGATTIAGCSGVNAGVLTVANADFEPGGGLSVQLDNAQGPGVFPLLYLSLGGPFLDPCGVVLPGLGEILIGFTPPDPLLNYLGSPWTGAPQVFAVPTPPDNALIGAHLHLQGVFFDPVFPAAEQVRLSNALRIVLGL